jgi:hypothetical protein
MRWAGVYSPECVEGKFSEVHYVVCFRPTVSWDGIMGILQLVS